MAGVEDLIYIRMKLAGGAEVAGELHAVGAEAEQVGVKTAAAGDAAAASSPKASRMGSTWSRVGKIVKFGALGAAGAIGGLALVAKSGLSDLTDLSKTAYGLHRNLGLTIRDGSRWASVAKARNIDTKSLNMTFATLSRNFVAANQGSATSLKLFHSLGISTKELQGAQGNFNKLILLTARGFGQAGGGAQRMHAAQTLLGRGYQNVLPLFAEGNKSLQEQLGWADKYHTSIGKGMVDDTSKLIAAQRQSTVAWLGIKMSLGAAVLPLVTKANTEFQNLAAKLTDPHLTTDEKLTILGNKLAHAAQVGFDAFTNMLPKLASSVGEHAPQVAAALIHGFLAANIWGKLALGVWFLTKIGLTGAIVRSMGQRIGTQMAGSAVAGWASESALFGTLGRGLGPILGRAMGLAAAPLMVALLGKALNDWLQSIAGGGHQGGFGQPSLPGGNAPPGTHHIGILPLPSFLNNALFGSTGGLITSRGMKMGLPGGSTGSDKIPGFFTDGEFLLREQVVRSVGAERLATFNQTGDPSVLLEQDLVGGWRPPSRPGSPSVRERVVHHQPVVLKVDGKTMAKHLLQVAETDAARA